MTVILTINAGSSNIKLAVFDTKTLERKGHSTVPDMAEAEAWICSAGEMGIVAVGHRVVHGGRKFTQPEVLNDKVIAELEKLIPLAPLHQPAALKLIKEARNLYPNVPHIACFDTAFHHTMPEIERRLPLPRAYHERGIQRYGFHGLSYQHIAEVMPKELKDKRVIVAHLGGGSSACAMQGGKSIASTMGFSTLDGLMMGTRPGALDAGVVLHLVQEKGMKAQEISDLLYKNSGLKGVSGISADIRELLASKKPEAKEAVELYCSIAAKHIAGLIPALGGADAFVFTGGIGEHQAQVRDSILSRLKWLGDVPVHIIPTDEELVMAQACRQTLKREAA